MLLAVMVLGHPAPSPQVALVQSASLMRFSVPDKTTDLEPTPRRLARLLAPASVRPQAIAAPVVRALARPKPATAGAPRVAGGTGQWGLINQDRQAAGLAPLQWSPCLANVATGQAARMAAQGYISHANGRSLDLACGWDPGAARTSGSREAVSTMWE